jgi:hypothetical protein
MSADLRAITEALNRLVAAQQKGVLDYANVGLLLLTLFVLVVYTLETLKLRRAAQRQNEIAVVPMLAVYLGSQPNESARDIYLENVGPGPAFNISIDKVVWAEDCHLDIDFNTNVMKPGQRQVLAFHRWQGNSGSNLGINDLYFDMNLNTIPNPLRVVVRCASLSETNYQFLFSCTPVEGRLKITFDQKTEDSRTRSRPSPKRSS